VKITCLPKGRDQYVKVHVPNTIQGSTQFKNNEWVTLYEGPAHQEQHQQKANIFSPPLLQGVESKIVMIHMNTSKSKSWSEIDAIELLGIPTEREIPGTKHLYVGAIVNVSSEYNGWPATNIIGKENVYPKFGDNPKAWAPSVDVGTFEFLTVDFMENVNLSKIEIFETYYPGALVCVRAYCNNPNTGDFGQIVYQGQVEENLPDVSRIKEIDIPQGSVPFPVRYLRLEMDTSRQRGFYEIDAIRISGLPAM